MSGRYSMSFEILDRAKAEGRELTADEQAVVDAELEIAEELDEQGMAGDEEIRERLIKEFQDPELARLTLQAVCVEALYPGSLSNIAKGSVVESLSKYMRRSAQREDLEKIVDYLIHDPYNPEVVSFVKDTSKFVIDRLQRKQPPTSSAGYL
jgi:hypothetical protein